MIVILGAGEYGKLIREKFLGEKKDVVFYDNDRRKWGEIIQSTEVVTLDYFLRVAKHNDTKIIIGSKNLSVLYFLKDVQPTCQILKVENEELVDIDFGAINEFQYDNSIEIGKKNLECYEKRLVELKENGNATVYKHALEYVEFKRNHLNVPEISSIELTNNCNLKCPNCPNSSLSFHKGYISDEVFEQAIKYIPPYKSDTVAVHCMGEPLMHPKIIYYLKRLAEIQVNICMSTNGILLDEQMSKEILAIFSKLDKCVLYVSFHTKKSVENWYKFRELYNTYDTNNIIFAGQVLEHNEREAHQWLREIGIDDPYNEPNIRHISSHSWAGNVSSRRTEYNDIEVHNRIRNCYYLRQRKVAVMWDGSLRGCCYDSNATQKCGNIFEFEKADINPKGYELCNCCDPDWITGYQ